MKKIIAIAAFSVMAASQVFAAGNAEITMALTSTGAVTGGTVKGGLTDADTLIGKTSTGVGFGAKTGVGGYTILTQHKSGSREIGGSFNSTTLVYKEVSTIGEPELDKPAASDFSAFETDGGWSSM